MNDFFTSWFAVIVFLFVGIFLIRSNIIHKEGSTAGRIKDYIGGFGAIAYAISLAIAKISGCVL